MDIYKAEQMYEALDALIAAREGGECAERLNDLALKVADIEAQQRWIPVSERLTEIEGYK